MSANTISDALENVAIVDTHEHFSDLAGIAGDGANLFAILPRAYVGFFDFYPGLAGNLLRFTKYPELPRGDVVTLRRFIDGYQEHEFVNVLDAGMRELHGSSIKLLSQETLDKLNASIKDRYADPHFRDATLRRLGIKRAVCDVPSHAGGMSPGFYREFDPRLYKPALRVNSLLFGFDTAAWNPGTCLMRVMADELKVVPQVPETFEEFIDAVDEILDWSKDQVASYKCASAYERPIDFGSKEDAMPGGKKWTLAKQVFGKRFMESTEIERVAFGDVVLHHVLGRIEYEGVPLQVHTGTAVMPGSDPRNLESLLAGYPGLTTTLLHCGYPWTREAAEVVSRHENARAEMAWLQMLSEEAAREFLERAIQAGIYDRVIAFGGDCACVEGTVGALMSIKRAFRKALNNLVARGVVQAEDVAGIAEDMFYNNPRAAFHLI